MPIARCAATRRRPVGKWTDASYATDASPGPLGGHLKEGWSFLLIACRSPEHPFHPTMQRILQWGQAVSPLITEAFSHHGRPVQGPGNPTLAEWDRPSVPQYDWRAETRVLADLLVKWFGAAFDGSAPVLPDVPWFHHEVAGLAVLADWIGPDRRNFEFKAPADAAYDRSARNRADQALERFGPDTSIFSEQPAPRFATPTGFPRPNSAQAVLGGAGTDARLVIPEAETGSGKTEAALWRFTQLLSAGKVSGLCFAVPTRSAARQLHRRIVEAMQRAFDNDAPESVLAIPGMLRAGEFDGHRLPGREVRWDDRRGGVPERWAAGQANRFLAATVAVGTADQAMLAASPSSTHMRGSALARNLLVIDEVHASDSYITEVPVRLLDGHLAVGGYVTLLSATLGSRARTRWMGDTASDFEEACATPYPSVWVKGERKPRTVTGDGHAKTVILEGSANPGGGPNRRARGHRRKAGSESSCDPQHGESGHRDMACRAGARIGPPSHAGWRRSSVASHPLPSGGQDPPRPPHQESGPGTCQPRSARSRHGEHHPVWRDV